MFDIYLFLDIIVVLGLAVLALTVFIKNRADILHRIFVAFVVCIAVWITTNYISNDVDNSPRVATIANYFVFSFSYAASVFLLAFAVKLSGDERIKNFLRKCIIPFALVTLSSATPLVVSGVELQGSLYAVEFGPLATPYFLSLITNIVLAIFVVHRNKNRSTGDKRKSLRVLLSSLYLTFPVLILAQAVIPATTGWFGLTNIGVLPMLILVFGLYYNVVKYRLFDLRLVAVRTIAYLATIGTISIAYGLITHNLTAGALSRFDNGIVENFVNSGFIVLACLSYGVMKRNFDKITNRLFYQDAYDPQALVSELNAILISNIELNKLLSESSRIIGDTIKAEFCTFELYETTKTPRRIVTHGDQKFNESITKESLGVLSSNGEGIIIFDELTEKQEKLKQTLRASDIAVVINLASNLGGKRTAVGRILLGIKRSGNPYSKQDVKIIKIIADEMVVAIQNALRFEEIQNFAKTLEAEVEEKTKGLRNANEKLKKLDETKDDFISMASHQLRTPLTSVKGYVSMVLEGDAGKVSTKQKELLDQAFVSSQRMVYLIADLLNVSRLRTGKFIIDAKPTNLTDVVEGEINQLKETAKGRGLDLKFDKPKEFPDLMLDETKIRQVIMNFADNAIYYTPTGGHIVVGLEDKGDSVEFTVSDDGIGVPKAEQHHLFNKFYRAGNAKKARPDGTGLGLFMAKKVVVAQGGAIIFNTTEGKGSTFGFSFNKKSLDPSHYKGPAVAEAQVSSEQSK